MADAHTKKVRSYNMSQIKATNTKPELVVRKFLHGNGYRFRIHDKKIFGKPDIALKRLNTLVFVHGCYWHSHKNCRFASVSKTNSSFWENKISVNIKRDEIVKKLLKKKAGGLLLSGNVS